MNVVNSQAVRNAMLARCIGVAELAKMAGLQPSIISKILRRDSTCRLPTIAKICKALQIEPVEILKGDDFNETQNKNLSA